MEKNEELNTNVPSSPYKIIKTCENRIPINYKNKKVIISNLLNGNSRNKGLNNFYKMYISKDFLEKIESPNKKYALYLPQVFTRKKIKEKKANNDSFTKSP